MKNKLPRSVWALGFVSLFMDVSSEMVHGLLPLFLSMTLGASAATVGLIAGAGDAAASLVKLFSGVISDRIGQRKPLAVLGYGLSALTKPFFAMAGAPSMVLAARLADRLGKGIRGAPRDALVADVTPQELRGAAYGLRQSLDTVGAVLGPLLAILLMTLSAGNIRLVFWVAILPAAAAVLVLAIFVREPPKRATPKPTMPKFGGVSVKALGTPFWIVAALGGTMTLARFSEAFLILRANEIGLAVAYAPLVLIVMNVVYAFAAWPVGALSDRAGKEGLLVLGFAILMIADIVFIFSDQLWSVLSGVALWGLHMGLTEGLLAALVAEVAPVSLRATAFGVFNLITGIAVLLASLLAGVLWSLGGSVATFLAGAGLSAIALIGVVAFARWRHQQMNGPRTPPGS